MKKRILSVVLCLCMVMGMVPAITQIAQASTNGHTQAEAVQWVKARADEHWEINDGSGMTQCTEFIWAYYEYLLGYHVGGHAYHYLGNTYGACPSGWTRPDKSTVQPGDIVIWDQHASFNARRSDYALQYGHIGIVVSVNGNSMQTAEANTYGSTRGAVQYKYDREVSCISGIIRPDWPSPQPTASTVNLGNDFYAYISYNGTYLQTSGIITENDQNMDIQTQPTSSIAAIWHFIRQSDGSYKIKNVFSEDWVLDVQGGNAGNGMKVRMWFEDHGAACQRWYIMQSQGSSTYRIVSALRYPDELYSIDLHNAAGSKVQLWQQNLNAWQQFTITEVSYSPPYTISVSASPIEGGMVTGSGNYVSGRSTTVTATANNGYVFKKWTENGRTVSTNTSYTFTVNSNRTLTAVFEQEQRPVVTPSYIVTTKANPAEGGAVSGDGVYQVGTDVTVTAKPKDGYEFKGWTEHGQTVSTSTSYSFTINASRDFVAVFEKKQAVQLKLTAPAASSITYGQKLSASTLSGGTATDPSGNVVSGTWAWKTPDTVPTGGRYQAVFIPSQNGAYKTPNPMGVSVPVDPAIPDIILSVPASCAAGDTANISTAVRNPHNTALSNLPSVNLSYRIGGKDYRISGGKLTVPAGTAAGTTITITASTNANSKYQVTQKTATIVVSGSLDSCANGHSWGGWSTLSAPTCTQAGQQVRTCIKCGAQDVEAVAARGHNYQKSGEYSVCTNCGDTIDSGNSSNVSGLDNFIQANTYYNGLFRDVSANAWYVDNVSSAYQLGLMKGRAAGVFSPENNVTFAETITLAARIHSIYTYGKENFESYDGGNWYDPYVNYARTNGIATENYNYNRPATREEFVHILVEALPREAIAGNSGRVSNFADTSSIVYSGDVEVLYKAGVIGGVDVGSLTYFMPGKSVTRAEAAAIITRMVQPGLRF